MVTFAAPFMKVFDFMNEYKYVLLFYVAIILIIYLLRKKFERQGIAFLYRTKFGLKLMDKIAKKFRWFIKNLGFLGIPIGYLGMVIILGSIVYGLYALMFIPNAPPTVAAALPGLPLAGTGYKLPFFEGIIAFFVIIVIHEFCHGVMSRVNNIKVKSSGFVMFGPIPGAFVEPDEKEMEKRIKKIDKKTKKSDIGPFPWLFFGILDLLFLMFIYFFCYKSFDLVKAYPFHFALLFIAVFLFILYTARYFHQKDYFHLSIFAAGPFANILTAIIVFLIIFLIFIPLIPFFSVHSGFTFVKVENNTPASEAGLKEFTIYNKINNVNIFTLDEFKSELRKYHPGQNITIGNTTNTIYVVLGNDPANYSRPYLGVQVTDMTSLKEGIAPKVFFWILGVLNWIFVLSIGLGLANLLPLGPVDGGRMFQVIMHMFVGEQKGNKIWIRVAIILLFIILLLFLVPIIKYLLI